MANRLKMAIAQAIQALRARGWSCRRIARELEIHRETVARYLRAMEPGPKPANALTGSLDEPDQSKPAKALTGSELAEADGKSAIAPTGFSLAKTEHASCGNDLPTWLSRSACALFREQILAKLELGLSAQRIYQDLRTEHCYAGSYYSVSRLVRKLVQNHPLPFRRMECEPGAEVQVDFGKAAPIITSDGKRRRPHLFRAVLSHSRKAYSEVTLRQTTEDLIRCLENAFWYFGGVPRVVVIDNLRAAVSHPDWYDPELNPKLQSFSRHYGTAILPTKSYTPRHKGKIERGVGYAQGNALRARRFQTIEEQNRFLLEWEQTIADTRIHGTTRKQVGQAFAEIERASLLPLPVERFPFFHEGKRSVHRDGHVEVQHAYYSVPPEYLGHELWVRWDARLVRIFNHHFEQIALHTRHEPGRFSTLTQHLASEKISRVERGAHWLLAKVSHIGEHTQQWAQAMLQARGIEGVRVLVGLLSLSQRFSSGSLEQACEIALSHCAFRLRTIRQLAERRAPAVKQLQFIEEHPLIRPLSEYAVRFGTCGEDTKRHGDFSKANRCVVPVSPMQQENKS